MKEFLAKLLASVALTEKDDARWSHLFDATIKASVLLVVLLIPVYYIVNTAIYAFDNRNSATISRIVAFGVFVMILIYAVLNRQAILERSKWYYDTSDHARLRKYANRIVMLSMAIAIVEMVIFFIFITLNRP